MIKVVICEDNINQLTSLYNLTKEIFDNISIQYTITKFTDGHSLLKSVNNFHIYLLDIQLDSLSGIDIARKIQSSNENSIIIFITALNDYIFDAFDLRAFNYILKPIDRNRYRSILYSAVKSLQNEDKFILTKYNGYSSKILLNDIIYIEFVKRKIKVHTLCNIFEYYYKLSDIEKELSNDGFFRCHKSYIVNLKFVQSYNNTSIILKNGEEIFLSKYKYLDFSKAFMYYLKNKEF
ncbi:LytR/AlgR family response regulator transcription factor [Clostridium neonatale]|uniref:LytR/AlgR family response regulator transcription factor n=1 Tax=Clostridium neonatale TaxID=137838 RepID=UPI00291B3B4C|nr:Stage 0 sporulation protein A homolog [Clostridium neonatale]